MSNRVQKFFTLVGLLKYGIILSALLIYLPFTALDKVPLHYLFNFSKKRIAKAVDLGVDAVRASMARTLPSPN